MTAYCTLAQIKSALALDPTNTTDDAWITNDLIPQAQSDIDTYVGLSWNPVTATRLYNGSGIDTILIDRAVSFSQVLLTPAPPTFGSVVVSAPLDITTDCALGPNPNVGWGFMLTRKSTLDFDVGTQNVSVTGSFGMPSIPPLLTRACTRLVIHYFKMRDSNYTEVVATGQFGSMKFSSIMPDDVVDMLERLKPRRFLMTGR